MAYGLCKYWNGSAWVESAPKVYNGSAHVATVGKFWNGSAWEQIWPGAGGTVTVSGETITDSSLGTSAAGIRVNADGTIDKYTTTDGYQPIDSGTDWIIPNGSASSAYEARVTGVFPPGSVFTSSPGADGTWFNLGSNREWLLSLTGSSGDTDTITFVLEIRDGSAVTQDTGSYSLTVDII